MEMALITITKSLGSEGTKIARRVCEELSQELYDDERLEKEAIGSGIHHEELGSLEEKAPGFFDRIWSKRPQLYMDIMESVMYEVSKRGHGVIMGHAGQFLLRDFGCALHILIDAAASFRIRNIATQYGVPVGIAEKIMHKSDDERQRLLRYAFHMDWDNHTLYDLVINSEKLGEHLSAHLISETVHSQVIEECGLTALSSMERLSLEKKLEAALLRANFNTTYLHIDVPETGITHVRGFADTKETRDRIVEILQSVPGVSRVESELWLRPASAV
jgi:cytidylate kinase